MKVEWQGLVADIWYDDRDPHNAGWYAEYFDSEGTYSDSMKVWEEEMPVRRNASARARAVALRALKREARRRRAKTLKKAGY